MCVGGCFYADCQSSWDIHTHTHTNKLAIAPSQGHMLPWGIPITSKSKWDCLVVWELARCDLWQVYHSMCEWPLSPVENDVLLENIAYNMDRGEENKDSCCFLFKHLRYCSFAQAHWHTMHALTQHACIDTACISLHKPVCIHTLIYCLLMALRYFRQTVTRVESIEMPIRHGCLLMTVGGQVLWLIRAYQ